MTALQIAREHCANWRGDGKRCLGAVIDDDLRIRRCTPKPKCLLGTPGERCLYFEECVAPMARSIANEEYRRRFEAVVREYRLAAKLPCAEERACPICGKPMEPRKQFCFACAAQRRRESTRLSMKRSRRECEQSSEKRPLAVSNLEK